MIITRIQTCQPIAANSPPDWRTSLGQIAVRIETDDGRYGYGVGGGGAAGRHVIDHVLAPLLTRRSSESVEELWEEMYSATLPFGRKGIAVMALSGVDLALWDLRAKRAGQPVAALFGGFGNKSLPTYTTVWDRVDAETAAGTGPAGASPVKLHVRVTDPLHAVDEIVERVGAARRAIGPERELMVDAWMKWDVELTLRVAERIAPLGIGWIEEPLSPDDLRGYEQLAGRCPIPIAGGEHEFTAAAFEELIERRLHAVLQPDVCWVGGLTELVKIYDIARTASVRVVPHRGAEIWALHAIAALDPLPLAESGRPWMPWVEGQPSIHDGRISVSAMPGFGVQLNGDWQ
ncbi:MAG: mandelate racemase/muconate lactonizing enzyme family protein [Planctomycetaceae bacterium]